MKVLLLIVAIYALIFNQASKQGNVKASPKANQITKDLQSADNIYLDKDHIQADKAPLYRISDKLLHRASPNYMFRPAVMQADMPPASTWYPYYPNTVNSSNRKS
ncbi:MAG: hypothetical protein J7527_12825 [Chitinophagaceae bacterium]|nr:hypothetical protein [Chitinophagaceae bacterium]